MRSVDAGPGAGLARIPGGLKRDLLADFGKLKEALEQELVNVSDIDQALERSLAVRFRLGMFDPPSAVPYSKISPSMIGTTGHIKAATEAARQSEPSHQMLGLSKMVAREAARLVASIVDQSSGIVSAAHALTACVLWVLS